MAEVLLYALMGHQTGALERLQSWPPEPAMAPWKRALRAWVTGDYRELNAVNERTPLEQIGWFSSYARSVQPTIAWEELAPEMLAARPDFCRMAQELALSVELGHQLSRLSLALELQEIGQVFKVSGRPPPGPEGLSSWLNELPSPCVSPGPGGAARIRVISEGHWAQFLQRHLCHTLVQNHRFLRRLWGVPEVAADFVRQTSGPFEKLRLYPFVQRAHAEDEKTYRQAVDAAVRVIAQTPELVPAALWNQLYEPPPAGLPVYHSPHCRDVSEWHRHNPPPFTAHRASDRVHHVSLIWQADAVERLEALHALAPYDITSAWGTTSRNAGMPPRRLSTSRKGSRRARMPSRPPTTPPGWCGTTSRRGPMRLLVWKGIRYLEASAGPPRRRFGAAFDTYLATP
ncbi:MAG: hypothetical protein M5U12_13975 [Verrucomicrobia bacterium]|nr:hypothetical protein [Verrucomicrobiota bacterium]